MYAKLFTGTIFYCFKSCLNTFIDKIYTSDPLKRGDYWGQTLYLISPYGLGIEDSV